MLSFSPGPIGSPFTTSRTLSLIAGIVLKSYGLTLRVGFYSLPTPSAGGGTDGGPFLGPAPRENAFGALSSTLGAADGVLPSAASRQREEEADTSSELLVRSVVSPSADATANGQNPAVKA